MSLNGGTGRYAPIEDYALLGDTRTAALVGSDGSIDWLCIPRFDGQPVFGRLVGGASAGSFRLGPAQPAPSWSPAATVRDSATLETTWQTDTGRLTLTEGMVAEVSGQPPALHPAGAPTDRPADGPVEAVIDFDPRLGERHRPPRTEHRGRGPGLQLVDHGRRAAHDPRRVHRARAILSRSPSLPTDPSPASCPSPTVNRSCTSTLTPPGWRSRTTSCAGRPGVATSTTTCPTARPWSAACSPSAC